MLAKVTIVDATDGCQICDKVPTGFYCTTIDELFRECQAEYGRCVSKQYQGRDSGAVQTGWVFQKRCKYTDVNETYLQEAWVTVYSAPATVTHHYYPFNQKGKGQ